MILNYNNFINYTLSTILKLYFVLCYSNYVLCIIGVTIGINMIEGDQVRFITTATTNNIFFSKSHLLYKIPI